MREVKQMAAPYVSRAAASKAAGVNQTQFDRWVQAGALVDEGGQVWIKTSKPFKGWKLRTKAIDEYYHMQTGMRKVKVMIWAYVSTAAGCREVGLNPSQFDRWVQAGALVDDDGQVWIKTAKPVEGWKL